MPPIAEKRFLNLASWPPVSIRRWTPVQAGCDLGSISSRMTSPALPQVDLVSNSVPSVMTTLMVWYSGWISGFMKRLQLEARAYRRGGPGAQGAARPFRPESLAVGGYLDDAEEVPVGVFQHDKIILW